MVSSDAGSTGGDVAPIFDYFFGSYVTPQAQRLRFVSVNGVQHASEISPRDPLPGQPVALSIIADAALPIDRVAVYFTVDGSEPEGARGQPARGLAVLAELQPEQDAVIGETPVHYWTAQLPGQPDGVLVRYRIDAWDSADPARRWLADAADYGYPLYLTGQADAALAVLEEARQLAEGRGDFLTVSWVLALAGEIPGVIKASW